MPRNNIVARHFCCPFSTIFELIYYGFKAAGKYCGLNCYANHSNGELHQQMLNNGEFREDNAYSAALEFLPT